MFSEIKKIVATGDKYPLLIDGTYKLHCNGWVLAVVGSVSVYYNSRKKKASHTFRPWAYAFVKSESSAAFTYFLKSVKSLASTLFGIEIAPTTVCCDHASAIQLAVANVFPGTVLTTCWPHVARKVRESHLQRLHDKGFYNVVWKDVQRLESCRSKQQFDNLARKYNRNCCYCCVPISDCSN